MITITIRYDIVSLNFTIFINHSVHELIGDWEICKKLIFYKWKNIYFSRRPIYK